MFQGTCLFQLSVFSPSCFNPPFPSYHQLLFRSGYIMGFLFLLFFRLDFVHKWRERLAMDEMDGWMHSLVGLP